MYCDFSSFGLVYSEVIHIFMNPLRLCVWFYAMVHSYVLQDIYDLKDQIQDVEGRYMQGLKELKVSGPSLQPKHAAVCAQKCQ